MATTSTLTQGQSYTDPRGNTGIVNFDTQTGKPLAQGATTPAPVPTSAPTGQTNTNNPPSNPVTVNSSIPAKNVVPTMVKTAQDASASIAAKQTQQAQDEAAGIHNSTGYAPDGSRLGNGTLDAGGKTGTATMTPEQKAADTIANTPDTSHKFVYDAQGNRTQVPIIDPVPAGFTAYDPKAGPGGVVTATAETPGMSTFKQFADGTYAQYDPNGNFQRMATQQEFDNTAGAQKALKALDDATANGTPLKPWQQDQINNIKMVYQNMLDKQATDNANLTGGTTSSMAMSGMGSSQYAAGQIQKVIDYGSKKIAELNSAMNSDIGKMTQAFQSENLAALKDAYNSYSGNVDKLDAQITKSHDEVVALQKEHEQAVETKNNQIDNDIRGIMDEAAKVPGGITAEQKKKLQDALDKHDYSAAALAVGDSLENAAGAMGQWYAYKKATEAANRVPGAVQTPILDPIAYKDKIDHAAEKLARIQAGEGVAAMNHQDKLENDYKTSLTRGLNSSRGGPVGNLVTKVDNAILARTLMENPDNYDPKTDTYTGITGGMYTDLASALAKVINPSSQTGVQLIDEMKQRTGQGDFNSALQYITGHPENATSQDLLRTLKKSLDREGKAAQTLLDQKIYSNLPPSGLEKSRADYVKGNLDGYPSYEKGLTSGMNDPIYKDQQAEGKKQSTASDADLFSSLTGGSSGSINSGASFWSSLTK